MIWTLLAAACGSAIGGAARVGLFEAMRWWWPERAEMGTLAANLLGCLLAGVALALMEPRGLYRPDAGIWKALLVAGLLGGFTTFSAFSVEALILAREGLWARAVFYVIASVIGGLALATAGFLVTQRVDGA